jgi:hypothetical protein
MTRPAFARTHGRLVTAWHCDPPVMSRYSGMECLKIGFFCERRRGFHLHEDLCHVQASRGDGSPAPPGETGELLLSNLFNRGSVLLNYRIGDRGALSDEPCPCGRSARLPGRARGRRDRASRRFHRGGDRGLCGCRFSARRLALPARAACVHGVRPRAVYDRVGRLPAGGGAGARGLRPLLRGCVVRPVRRHEIPLAPGGKHRFVLPLDVD